MLSDDRRREIAAFLRIQRERLQPEEVNLPRGSRRRTPGLRREEVAALSGVSTEWYTWLEQARDVQASLDTLRRIAGALKLDRDEARHLMTLAGYGETVSDNRPRNAALSPRLQRLLNQFEHSPAWVHGERWDFIGWNRAALVIHEDLDVVDGMARNGVYRLFTYPRMREMLVDWEKHARDIVAKLRAAHARNVDDPWFNELVDVMRAQSVEFARWWNEHNVQLPLGGTKRYRHPQAGLLTFDFSILNVSGESFNNAQLVAYVAADAATKGKMEALLSEQRDAERARVAVAP